MQPENPLTPHTTLVLAVDASDRNIGAVTIRTLPGHGGLRYVAPVTDPTTCAIGPCWVQWAPQNPEPDDEPVVYVPASLRAGDIIVINRQTRSQHAQGIYGGGALFCVVNRYVGAELHLAVFDDTRHGMAGALEWVKIKFGAEMAPTSLHAALETALSTATGPGARALDVLLRALATGPGTPQHGVVTALAQHYARHQRPRA